MKRIPKSEYGTGASSIFGHSGPERARIVDEQLVTKVGGDEGVTIHLQRWLEGMKGHMLHANEWSDDDLVDFGSTVTDITEHWNTVTGQNLVPKHHMLLHCLLLALKHRALGRFSEAPMESMHARWRIYQEINFGYKGSDTEAKLKGVLQLCAWAGWAATDFEHLN